ncbi:hypothetical protein FLK61_24770 [Paenalkalicoccus suaedae]|uniref:Uncharacterized protein n=1 Tax=Paenalkalicoccus suaedae TaxID=2592382 RepID=A0A859FBD9_9BACI|nr:hypothetical protein [Paenalkalicoccus suaedae]QKS69991.1 hypothetical protein FLK61_24770 [Paenalkalicoccus suaedae]
MKKHEPLVIPSRDKQKQQRALILTKGMPQPTSFLGLLKAMLRELPMRAIMGKEEALIAIILSVFFLFSSSLISETFVRGSLTPLLGMIVAASPLLFCSLLVISIVIKMQARTIELEMTMKYTIYHIFTLKMILIGLWTIVLNSATGLIYATTLPIDIWRIFTLSGLSLTVFAIGFLFAVRRRYTMLAAASYIVLWTIGHLSLLIFEPTIYTYLLETTPTLLLAGLLLASGIVMSDQLIRFSQKKQGGMHECFEWNR